MRTLSPMVDVAQYLGTGSDGDVVAQGGVALAALVSRAAECDALVQHAIIADDGGLPDDDSHGVVDEQATPDLRGGMNLDAGEKPGDLRENACDPCMPWFHSQCSGVCIHLACSPG